jgi:UDP-N-acetylmuramoylalanine--D-glutamate ligase
MTETDKTLRGRRVVVMGLGRFGGNIAVTRWLTEQGARVLVTDKEPADKLVASIAQLDGLAIDTRFGEHRETDFTSAELIVASPAVPLNNEFLAAARDADVPITTEIRLFVERNPAPVIGVTGTKGKSTTTAMLGRMLSERFRTWVGGNIGTSLLPELKRIGPEDLVVLELSSFMLEHLKADRFSPKVAVVTMLAADHLEWHGSIEAYLDAKANIVRWQKTDDIAVLPAIGNPADARIEAIARLAPGKIVRFGGADAEPFALRLAGRHNQLNAQAAFAAAACFGVTRQQAQRTVMDFAGLPHRMQVIYESRGVRWIDDSNATNPQAASAALDSFATGVTIQIVGGKDKGLDMTPLARALADRAKATICIGQSGPAIADFVRIAADDQRRSADIRQCADLASAVRIAREIATDGDVVLLSPGYSSFDQFVNFEQRGDVFAELVRRQD